MNTRVLVFIGPDSSSGLTIRSVMNATVKTMTESTPAVRPASRSMTPAPRTVRPTM